MKLGKLKLTNYRNFKSFEIDLEQNPNVEANNGFGKSNIADAISYILIGKLMDGSSEHDSIKPKNDLKALVSAELDIILENGSVINLKKTYRENWIKTRGGVELEMKGHATSCYINGVEYTITNYEKEIERIVGMPLEYVPIILDPTYFALKLEWKQRRQFIMEIVGEITPTDVINGKPLLEPLRNPLMANNGKVDITKKSFSATLKKIKEQEQVLIAQIDGMNLLVDSNETEYQEAVSKLAVVQDQIKELEIRKREAITEVNKPLELKLKSLQGQINEQVKVDNELNRQRVAKVKEQAEGLDNQIVALQEAKYKLEVEIRSNEVKSTELQGKLISKIQELSKLDSELQTLRNQFKLEKEHIFNQNPPTKDQCEKCGFIKGDYEKHYKEFLKGEAEFKVKQAELLKDLNNRGTNAKYTKEQVEKDMEVIRNQIQSIKDANVGLTQKITELTPKINELSNNKGRIMAEMLKIEVTAKFNELNNELLSVKKQMENPDITRVTNDLNNQIQGLETTKVSYSQIIDKHNTKLVAEKKANELKDNLTKTRQELAMTERNIDLLSLYVQELLEILNNRLKEKLGEINFRLIEANIKEGSFNEVCDVMDGLVPYDRTNTASQIKLGIKLIEAIRKAKSWKELPILVDNAEAVVLRHFDTKAQVINLIASGKGRG
jgi:chromosome segregation ATPase